MITVRKLIFLSMLVGALAVLGSGNGDDGQGGNGGGGDTGNGGDAGNGGTAGVGGGGGIVTGLYSSQPRGAIRCLFVNQDGTRLVADPSCRGDVAFYLLDLGEAMVQDDCLITYPEEGDDPQEVPIVDGQFTIETTRTDGLGEYTIMVNGEFTENGSVSGVGSHSRDCPDERAWSAGAGCCSQCEFCK